MTNLRVDSDRIVTVDLVNTGPRSGAQVVQLYLGFPAAAAGEPPQLLKGFEKVWLAPGATKTVTFALTPRDLSTWDTRTAAWVVAKGTFAVGVGTGSRDPKMLHGAFAV
jgi:beta-glucosidase